MKYFNRFLIVLILGVIVFSLYCSRQIFYYHYEPAYYESWYYHSQWNYPNSTRGISDGELYKFVGYQLANGENPFNLNFEVPPLGKYLYGLAEKYLGNPYWVTLLFYFLSLVVLYFLTKELFWQNELSLLCLLFFVTTPFVTTQISETMLDLPLMFFYLTHVFWLVKFFQKNKFHFLVLSGFFLGLATGTKPGVFTPFVGLFGFFLIFFYSKKIIKVLSYLVSVVAGYCLAFFCYFIRHPNPLPWIRLHEKPLKFYLLPNNSFDHWHVWKSIFLNSYQGWWWPDVHRIGGASLILPLGVLILLPALVLSIKKKSLSLIYIFGLALLFLIINTFIPFFPRYLMPVIPLLIITVVFWLKKYPKIIMFLALLSFLFLISIMSYRNSAGDLQAVARFFSTRAYQELYRSLTPEDREKMSEKDFVNLLETFLEKLGTREIHVKVIDTKQKGKLTKVKYQIQYLTKYGLLEGEPEVEFALVHNQWRMMWTWNFLFPGYRPENRLVIKENSIALTAIFDKQGNLLAKRGPGKMIYIFPRVMFDWNKYLGLLAKVTGDPENLLDARLRLSVPDHFVRFAGYLNPVYGQEGLDFANRIPGTELRNIDYLIPISGSAEISQILKNLQMTRPELFFIRSEAFWENNLGERIPLLFENVASQETVIRL